MKSRSTQKRKTQGWGCIISVHFFSSNYLICVLLTRFALPSPNHLVGQNFAEYCWASARCGSFFPSNLYADTCNIDESTINIARISIKIGWEGPHRVDAAEGSAAQTMSSSIGESFGQQRGWGEERLRAYVPFQFFPGKHFTSCWIGGCFAEAPAAPLSPHVAQHCATCRMRPHDHLACKEKKKKKRRRSEKCGVQSQQVSECGSWVN